MKEKDLIKIINEASAEAKSTWQPLFDNIEKENDFTVGNQWEHGDAKRIRSADAIPVVINIIKKQVDSLVGKRLATLTDLRAYPIEFNDDVISDMLTKTLKWVTDSCNAQTTITSSHKDQIIGGLGWLHTYIDFSEDYLSGDIKISHEAYSNILPDPHFRNLDLSDADYIIRYKLISKSALKLQFPDKAEEIESLKGDGDSIFKFNKVDGTRNSRVVVKEYWYRTTSRKQLIVNKYDTSDSEEWGGDKDRLKVFLRINPDFMLVEKNVQQIRLATLADGKLLLQDVPNPYSKKPYFPFIPIIGYYNSSTKEWKDKIAGHVRALLFPQMEKNARRSAMLTVTMKFPRMAWKMEEGAVKDISDLKRMGGREGVIVHRPGRNLDLVTQTGLPTSEVQLEQMFSNDLSQVGLVPEVIGSPSDLSSAKAMSLVQASGLIPVAELNEHLNFALRLLGQQIIDLSLEHFEDSKFQLICGDSFQIDPAMLEKARKSTRFDIKVDETTQSVTSQMAAYESIMQGVQHGVQVPYITQIEQNPYLPSDIKKKCIEQYQQQQQQQMEAEQAQQRQQTELAQQQMAMQHQQAMAKIQSSQHVQGGM
jgi:hypothetical protein